MVKKFALLGLLLLTFPAHGAFYPTVDQGVPGPAASPWPVIAVTGTSSIGQVTANAGTNLNTSALTLETTQLAGNTLTGAVNETAPVSDTASVGLNGRLQRIAQRLTSLIAVFNPLSSQATPSSSGVVVRPLPFEPQTYHGSSVAFVPPASATDIFTITGSATKTIRIHKIRVSGTTTSGSAIKTTFSAILRSTADSGGTRVAVTVGKNDSTNAAATATVGHYTANPTLGTTASVLRAESLSVQSTGITSGDITWEFSDDGAQPIYLRGTSEQMAINLNGASVTGPVFSISVEWSEI